MEVQCGLAPLKKQRCESTCTNATSEITRSQIRPDPRTVLLVAFVLNVLVMARPGMPALLMVSGIIFAALLTAKAFSWALAFLLIQVMWLFLVFVLPMLWPSSGSAFLVILAYWMCKFCAAGGIAAYAFRVIYPGELVVALRRLRVPIFITVPIIVLLRFIPIVFGEYRAVREAMALRGLHMGWQALLHPLRYLEFILVPLLSSCARIADEMTAAGMVRGLGSKARPTTLKHLRFGFPDLLWLLTLTVLFYLVWLIGDVTLVPGGFK